MCSYHLVHYCPVFNAFGLGGIVRGFFAGSHLRRDGVVERGGGILLSTWRLDGRVGECLGCLFEQAGFEVEVGAGVLVLWCDGCLRYGGMVMTGWYIR